MVNMRQVLVSYFLLTGALILSCHCFDKQVYVVYMGDRPKGDAPTALMHHYMLTGVLGSASLAQDSLIYSYGRSFNGFVAKLSDDEVRSISEMEEVVSVMPNHMLQLHTTRSWDFMGFSRGDSEVGSHQGDVIVGLLDTGIWPESESFKDVGFSPPPSRWKGVCQGVNFTCNNKLIGARGYSGVNLDGVLDVGTSPRDHQGHGTHTSSIAAGNAVEGASYFGLAKGVARGGAPRARIAMYKVCWSGGCPTAAILAAFDDAIADGVDILSVSLGLEQRVSYLQDAIAIGSFHAMRKGILTSNSAGNSGPRPDTMANLAPWTITVAASTIDRKFVAQVVLGNGLSYTGLSINGFDLNGQSFPLVWGGDAANYSAGADADLARLCSSNALNANKVRGKIVLCDVMDDGSDILTVNGVGTIMTDWAKDFAFSYPLPATQVSTEDAAEILSYIRSTENPVATILFGETWKDPMAARVASFSSRGPNSITPDILKPDITAPGVDILAAWPTDAPPSYYYKDPRTSKFYVMSGTSMSCPHVSGAAAYVKSFNPTWSPAAVKSALMTTATRIDPRKHSDLEFAYGSGHINPVKAVDPGLVYDASEIDYVKFLCSQGYNSTTLQLITGDNSTCDGIEPGKALELNYPSFTLSVEDGQPISGVFTRTLTNVGPANSSYTAIVSMPELVNAFVEPSMLSFSAVGETKTFTLKLSGPNIEQQPIMSGAITWSDEVHLVRSPVVIYNIIPGGFYWNSVEAQKTISEVSLARQINGILRKN